MAAAVRKAPGVFRRAVGQLRRSAADILHAADDQRIRIGILDVAVEDLLRNRADITGVDILGAVGALFAEKAADETVYTTVINAKALVFVVDQRRPVLGGKIGYPRPAQTVFAGAQRADRAAQPEVFPPAGCSRFLWSGCFPTAKRRGRYRSAVPCFLSPFPAAALSSEQPSGRLYHIRRPCQGDCFFGFLRFSGSLPAGFWQAKGQPPRRPQAAARPAFFQPYDLTIIPRRRARRRSPRPQTRLPI